MNVSPKLLGSKEENDSIRSSKNFSNQMVGSMIEKEGENKQEEEEDEEDSFYSDEFESDNMSSRESDSIQTDQSVI